MPFANLNVYKIGIISICGVIKVKESMAKKSSLATDGSMGIFAKMAVVMADVIQLNEISVTMAHSDLNSRRSISSFASIMLCFVNILFYYQFWCKNTNIYNF